MPRNAPKPNRTDLNLAGPTGAPPPGMGQPNGQAVATPTGLPYGENQALQQAQQAVPVAGGPPPPAGPSAGPPQSPIDAAKNYQMPNVGLMNPSERPNEPITAGLPGSPASPGIPTQNAGTISAMLTKMAASTGSGALNSLAARAQQVGQ